MGRKPEGKRLRMCYCVAFQCAGKAISAEVFTLHQERSEELALQEIEKEIVKMTICDSFPLPNSAPHSSLDNSKTETCSKKVKDAYGALVATDGSINQHEIEIMAVLAEWDAAGLALKPKEARFRERREATAFLSREKAWACDISVRLSQTPSCGDEINANFIRIMIERVDSISQRIEQRLRAWQELDKHRASATDYYNTGKFLGIQCAIRTHLLIDRYFNHPLRKANPALIITMFIAVALSVIANVSRSPCNLVLRLIKHTLQLVAPSATWDNIPEDIRTARQKFDLDPVTTTYATCPTCSFLYAPIEKDGHQIYPARCDFKRYPSSRPCGARLTKFGVEGGISVRVPMRPFVLQSFTDFAGKLYCRPGIEEMIRRTKQHIKESDDVRDINQGSAIRQFRGPDGKIFVDCEDELRTVWSFSYDAFNPYHNKAAGKSASVGSIAMECISLPSSIRQRPENIFFAGAVPGPKQPSLDGLNPFIAPLVDILDRSYHQGTWFSRTYEHPEGRRSREAIIPSVNDLPGSRKVAGCAGHSATRFCSLCYLPKSDINCLDESKFKPVTAEEHRRHAKEWLDATSKSKRKALFKKHGVRWSELLRLSYWDPILWVVVDGMHTLLLGITRHHFRVVIGTKWDERDDEVDSVLHNQTPKEVHLEKGRRLLGSQGTTVKQLESLPIPALRQLCIEYDVIQAVTQMGHRVKKRPFANALLVR